MHSGTADCGQACRASWSAAFHSFISPSICIRKRLTEEKHTWRGRDLAYFQASPRCVIKGFIPFPQPTTGNTRPLPGCWRNNIRTGCRYPRESVKPEQVKRQMVLYLRPTDSLRKRFCELTEINPPLQMKIKSSQIKPAREIPRRIPSNIPSSNEPAKQASHQRSKRTPNAFWQASYFLYLNLSTKYSSHTRPEFYKRFAAFKFTGGFLPLRNALNKKMVISIKGTRALYAIVEL